ncbi:MAG: hypothetical protein QME74_03595 [Candidatus Edwardsbacteria bacterium]|nr:hypothetical protein [Candidatus Edwardsbacteria bacterium]
MPDISDKIKSFLDKMMRVVPGYSGYADKENRRNTDKILRLHLASQLAVVKATFDGFTAGLTNQPGTLDLMMPANSITKLLEKVIDRLKFADYGYAGFFDSPAVMEPQLDALYQFDLDLSAAIVDIKSKASVLKPDPAILAAFLEDLRAFDKRLNARHEAITNAKTV